MNPNPPSRLLHDAVLAIFAAGLIALVYLVLRPFLASIAWAFVFCHATWPVYLFIRKKLGGRSALSATVATLLLGLTLMLPLFFLVMQMQIELVNLYSNATKNLSSAAAPVPDFVINIPLVGSQMHDWLERVIAEPTELKAQFMLWAKEGINQLPAIMGGMARNLGKFAFAFVTLFVLYLDGEVMFSQVRRVLVSLLGERVDVYLNAAGNVSRAIMLSMIAASLIQGMVAALGYWLFGLEAPVALGALTALTALIPIVGTGLVWAPASIYLLANGHLWLALGLAAWGIVLIHPIDNLIRPLLISSAAQLPFLLTMFGVFGGIAEFGMIGIFLGPVILAVAAEIWREWVLFVSESKANSEQIPK